MNAALTDVNENCPTSTTSSTTTTVVDVQCSSTSACISDTDTVTDTVMERSFQTIQQLPERLVVVTCV